MPDSNKKVGERDLVFFDTETTGVEFDKELIEIGLVKAKAETFEVVGERDIKILPQHIERADPVALDLIHYDAAEWQREGVGLKAGLEIFLSYTEDATLVGHNLPFDWLRIEKGLYECELKPNYFYKGFDTFPIAWSRLRNDPKFAKFSLEELSKHFGIDQGRAHRAIDDARTTYRVFLALLDSTT